MTEKRFINDVDNGMLYDTKGEMYTICYDDRVDFYSLWEFLNKLNDENEQLKKENNELRQSFDKSLLSHTKICDEYRILSKKNKRLTEENKQLKEKNATIKGRIINAIVKSNQVECNCSPCICEDYVNEELKKW